MPLPVVGYVASGARNLAAHYNAVKDYLDWLMDPPGCSAYRTVTGTLPTATWSAGIGLDAEDYKIDVGHNTATQNSRIVFTTAGRYRVTPRMSFASNGGGGYRIAEIRLNAGGSQAGGTFMARVVATGVNGDETVLTDSWSRFFNAGDYIEMFAYQTSGSNVSYAVGIRKVHVEVKFEGTT